MPGEMGSVRLPLSREKPRLHADQPALAPGEGDPRVWWLWRAARRRSRSTSTASLCGSPAPSTSGCSGLDAAGSTTRRSCQWLGRPRLSLPEQRVEAVRLTAQTVRTATLLRPLLACACACSCAATPNLPASPPGVTPDGITVTSKSFTSGGQSRWNTRATATTPRADVTWSSPASPRVRRRYRPSRWTTWRRGPARRRAGSSSTFAPRRALPARGRTPAALGGKFRQTIHGAPAIAVPARRATKVTITSCASRGAQSAPWARRVLQSRVGERGDGGARAGVRRARGEPCSAEGRGRRASRPTDATG